MRLLSLLMLSAALLAAAAQDQNEQKAAPAKDAAPAQTGAATYVGSETCQACHDEIHKAFQKNRHVFVETGKKFEKWNKQACEACHGPGSIHAESADPKDIIQPAKQTSARADKICLTCHLNQPTHAGRIQGGHARSAVSCTSCHSIHGPTKQASLDCTACHSNNWAQFNRPFGHKLGKNTMTCTDCHNPHGGMLAQGTQRTHSMRTFGSNEPGCFRCHGNLRGPFVFEHASVRLGGCITCHDPHNSVNPRMLTRHEVRFTCLECHANISSITANPNPQSLGGPVPPAFHDLSNPRFRQCTMCHVKIHGSQANRSLLR
jgi:DmsE family decaheme c-type cytochrome